MVLQKVPVSSPHKTDWDARVERYAEDFPDAYVVDLPRSVRQLSNRDTMLDAVRDVESKMRGVRAPRQIVADAGTEAEVRAQVAAAGLHLPLLAKSLRADGTVNSHKVAIIHDEDGLACVARGGVPGLEPPCVIQEYVNHGGCLFKVYVVGDAVTMTRRRSLPDLRGARRSNRRRAASAAAAAATAATVAGAGAKPKGSRARAKGKDDADSNTADVDGDVDDSEGDEEDEDAGWMGTGTPSGLQSVPRVSCFRGGASDGEWSWRDRLSREERARLSAETSSLGGDASDAEVHYLGAHGLERHAARVLTIDRVGSQDSIGTGQSFGSLAAESSHDAGNDSRGEDEGEGDAAGGSGSSRAARAGGAGVGLPPLAPGSLARVGTHARVPRRAGSSAAGSDANITTSDGGTGTESEPGGEDGGEGGDATPSRLGDRSLAVRRNQTPDFMPETPAPERSAVPAPGEEFVRELALGLRDALRLRLFNFDLIRVNGDGDEFLVVDINYFPGIAKMPGYCETFCAFLRDAKGRGGATATDA